jgi:hypothetical protein
VNFQLCDLDLRHFKCILFVCHCSLKIDREEQSAILFNGCESKGEYLHLMFFEVDESHKETFCDHCFMFTFISLASRNIHNTTCHIYFSIPMNENESRNKKRHNQQSIHNLSYVFPHFIRCLWPLHHLRGLWHSKRRIFAREGIKRSLSFVLEVSSDSTRICRAYYLSRALIQGFVSLPFENRLFSKEALTWRTWCDPDSIFERIFCVNFFVTKQLY